MYLLTIITYYSCEKESTELAQTLQSILGLKTEISSISLYSVDIMSFCIKLEIKNETISTSEQIQQMISIADQIAEPWIIYYDKLHDKIKLLYSDTDYTKKRQSDFEMIKRAKITCI